MLGSTGKASQTPGELKAPSADSAATPFGLRAKR